MVKSFVLGRLVSRRGRLHAILVLFFALTTVAAADDEVRSYHVGVLHPNGVDVAGYSVEKPIGDRLYRFYTFGFPSLAAAGLSYYANYRGNGLTGTVGVGIGSVLYASLAYQWRLEDKAYLKLGAGGTAGVAYSGAYPVLSYERRF